MKFLKVTISLAVFLILTIFLTDAQALSSSQNAKTSQKHAFKAHEIVVKFKDTLTESASVLLSDQKPFAPALEKTNDTSVDQLISKYQVKSARHVFYKGLAKSLPQLKQEEREINKTSFQRFPQRAKRTLQNSRVTSLYHVYSLTIDPAKDIKSAVKEFADNPNVEYAQPNYVIEAQMVPNDPYYSSQGSWGQPAGRGDYDDLWTLKKIQAAAAWDINQGSGSIVAVVDSGVYNSPFGDLGSNIWTNPQPGAANSPYPNDVNGWNFVNNTNDVNDDNGHGTHVAGIIAAIGNNAQGIIGVAPLAKIMPIKALDVSGRGLSDHLALGIRYAVDHGADVINNSWGCNAGCPTNPVVEDAVTYAYNHGVVVVFAAGNANKDISGYSPQNMHLPIVVSSFDHDDQKSSFSNYGLVDVAAPGSGKQNAPPTGSPQSNILSLRALSAFGSDTTVVGTFYRRLAGTSMAAPFVSGAAALLASKNPTWTIEQIRSALRSGANDVSTAGWDNQSGYGRLNLQQSLLINNPLESLITKMSLIKVGNALQMQIFGTARGVNFLDWNITYGVGSNPTTWLPIGNSNTAVNSALFTTWSGYSNLSEGTIITIRLSARNSSQKTFEDRRTWTVNNVYITGVDQPYVKSGAKILISGRAAANGFLQYTMSLTNSAGDSFPDSVFNLTGGGTGIVTDGPLGELDTTGLPADKYKILLFVDSYFNGTFKTTTKNISVIVDPSLAPGWPKALEHPDTTYMTTPIVVDLDGDGQKEIFAFTENGTAYLWNADGTFVAGWPKSLAENTLITNSNTIATPIALNVMGGAGSQIVFYSQIYDNQTQTVGHLNAYKKDGTQAPGWPIEIAAPYATYTNVIHPTAGDIDGDGQPEILLTAIAPHTVAQPINESAILAWHANGTPVSGWPKTFAGDINSPAALADVNHDGKKDIIFATAGHGSNKQEVDLHVIDGQGNYLPGWPAKKTAAGYSNQPVTVGDVDKDGELELFLGTFNNFYAFNHLGMDLPGWSGVNIQGQFSFAPVLADLNHNGQLQLIVIGTIANQFNTYGLYIFNPDGTPWFSQTFKQLPLTSGNHDPIIADINGDGLPDLITADGEKIYAFDIYSFRNSSEVALLPNFPKLLNSILDIENVYLMNGSPLVASLTADKKVSIVYQDAYYLYVWQQNALFSPLNSPWPMYGNNNARTYVYPDLPYEQWKASHFSPDQISNSTMTAEGADPDRDGRSNLLEYAFNLNPALNDSYALKYYLLNNYFTIEYRKNKKATDLLYQVGAKASLLGNWDYTGFTNFSQDLDIDTQLVTSTDSVDITSVPMRFFRMLITKQTGVSTNQTLSFGLPASYYSLNVTTQGAGSVTSTSGSINCGPICTIQEIKGKTEVLTSIPASGYKFEGWSGACTGNDPTCSVQFNKPLEIKASFSKVESPNGDAMVNMCFRCRIIQVASYLKSRYSDKGATEGLCTGKEVCS